MVSLIGEWVLVVRVCKMNRACPHCQKIYTTYPCKLKKGWQHYCSTLCSSIARRFKVERICEVCREKFIVKRMAIINSGAKYCSYHCMNKAQIGKRRPSGENARTWKGGITLIPKFCIDCGEKLGDHRSTRCTKCVRKKELHPNWKGGISCQPYPFEFNDKLKERTRKRDNYECKICGIADEEHILIYNRCLSVHHIDYVKENCNETNLVSLCNQCHTRTNYNREYWKCELTKIVDITTRRKV